MSSDGVTYHELEGVTLKALEVPETVSRSSTSKNARVTLNCLENMSNHLCHDSELDLRNSNRAEQ